MAKANVFAVGNPLAPELRAKQVPGKRIQPKRDVLRGLVRIEAEESTGRDRWTDRPYRRLTNVPRGKRQKPVVLDHFGGRTWTKEAASAGYARNTSRFATAWLNAHESVDVSGATIHYGDGLGGCACGKDCGF